MIKTYCDICGKEITSLDKARQYKIKKARSLVCHILCGNT